MAPVRWAMAPVTGSCLSERSQRVQARHRPRGLVLRVHLNKVIPNTMIEKRSLCYFLCIVK
jgi:hypothetical protein